jgi:hypothetical protein
MRYSGLGKYSEITSPPAKRRTTPSEQTDEAPGLIEREQVDVERAVPLEDHESVERGEPQRPDRPLYED